MSTRPRRSEPPSTLGSPFARGDKTLVGLVALLAAFMLGGCGYPEVSPKTYEIATALYGICNRELADKLPMAEQLVDEAVEANEITSREAGWLRDIIETARAGDWDDAEREARELMQDQVRRGENLGPPHRHDHATASCYCGWTISPASVRSSNGIVFGPATTFASSSVFVL